ncbi:MAG: hypothetical protein M1813_009303 [Trichoglossum hirsutum]|nr:MAG: hypothetical protein M1813_009303 [Trichoglossum hirsutum]
MTSPQPAAATPVADPTSPPPAGPASLPAAPTPTATQIPAPPTQHDGQAVIEPDTGAPGSSDGDSAFEDGASYATSVASSVYNYRFENGRRYHAYKEGEYPLPNDEKEQDRLDLIHHLHCLILNDKLHVSPIGEIPGRVLDIGTGTGIWAIDFADEYPSAEVTGTDLSPIQPQWVPPNLTFIIDDCESPWSFSSKFNFIHARTLGGSIKDLPALLKQAYDNLEPGGWLELQEYETTSKTDDDSFPEDSALLRWIDNLNKAAATFGKPTNIAPELKQHLIDAGFAGVEDYVYKVPMTPWAKDKRLKEQGRFNQLAMLDSLQAYTLHLFTNVLGWTVEEAEVYLVDVRKELMDPKIHMYST